MSAAHAGEASGGRGKVRRFRSGLAEKNRVEAFSDGVIAIVVTLLVLELKVPRLEAPGEAELWAFLRHVLPEIVAWVVSFAFVLVFWVSHHYFFARLARVDRGLLWLNGVFLLAISFTPFPTGLAGAYPASTPAVFMLSLAMFLTAAAFSAMRAYVLRAPQLARDSAAGPHGPRRAFLRGLAGPVLYAIAIVLSFHWVAGAMAIQVLVPLLFFWSAGTEAGTDTEAA